MSQADCLEYLKKQKEPKTSIEISEALKVNSGASLFRLRKHNEINFKKLKKKSGGSVFIYWTKKENEK